MFQNIGGLSMQARDVEPPVAPVALAGDGAAESSLGETIPLLSEILGPAEASARGMLEAEEALSLVRHGLSGKRQPS